jgi:hypothetical protein
MAKASGAAGGGGDVLSSSESSKNALLTAALVIRPDRLNDLLGAAALVGTGVVGMTGCGAAVAAAGTTGTLSSSSASSKRLLRRGAGKVLAGGEVVSGPRWAGDGLICSAGEGDPLEAAEGV